MYNVKRLMMIAREGLTDLLPSIRQAFNDDPTDDQLDQVYGSSPRANILGLAVVGVIAGELLARILPNFSLKEFIHWPAVIIGVFHAVLIRRYLFDSTQANPGDFPWLAASLVPATLLLVVVTAVSSMASGIVGASEFWPVIGLILVAVTDAIGVAAALTIAVAALCYHQNWIKALGDLAIRLFVFKLMVWVTVLVMLEIGIVGPIVSALFEGILGWRIPSWIPELLDQVSYVALMTVIYLAVIGATWTVCRKSFPELLETGYVPILDTIVEMAKDSEKKKAE